VSAELVAKCKGCGQKNRVADRRQASRARYRCGACKREFTDADLVEASVAATFGAMGVKEVRFADEDGTDRGGFKCGISMNLREAAIRFRAVGGTVEKVHGTGEVVFLHPALPRRIRVNERKKSATREVITAVRRLEKGEGQ
jgi:DNA-directed RNA polymerase subunit RPC12/RpoP